LYFTRKKNPGEKMSYKVFVSHSTRDKGLVVSLSRLLAEFGIEVAVAEWYLMPGERLDRKVLGLIDAADCMVVLLTRNGIRSNWVHQEVGQAMKSQKPIIPLVEKGIESKELAALEGREYIEYVPYQPEEALLKAAHFVKTLKLKKQEREKALLVVAGIIAFLLLLSGGEK
jgi:hypothetical protein